MTSNLSLTGQHAVSNQWETGEGTPFSSTSPVDNATLWQGHSAQAAEVERAVAAARKAFPAWSRLTPEARAEYLKTYVSVVEENKETLAELIHRETGKPLWESRTEAASVMGKIGLTLNAYEKRTGYSESPQGDGVATLAHRALGVFAVLGPYNFPAHLPNGHIAPALLAGNTLVFKPSELTPAVGEFLVRCWLAAGLPDGVLNLVQGDGSTGGLLSQHPDLNGLLFTGSSNTGVKLHAQFAGQPDKMLALEMGGNNPLIVHDSRDVNAAVYTIIQSAFLSAGQRCTCARRLILVDSAESRALLEVLVKATAALKVGVDDDAFMGPVISQAVADMLVEVQAQWQAKGAKLCLPLARVLQDIPLVSPGIVDVTGVADIEDKEYFGPLLKVQFVADVDAAIEEANNTRYGLSAGLLSDSAELWQTFYSRSRAGIVNWNRQTTGASGAAPFGGTGLSGNLRPSAFYAADYCAYPVASLQSTQLVLPAQLTPGVSLPE